MKKQYAQASEENTQNEPRPQFQGRYRGNGPRRNRSRPMNEGRGSSNRQYNFSGNRDRRSNNANWRDNSNVGPNHAAVNHNIDINDSEQWPSIQESSTAPHPRVKNTGAVSQSSLQPESPVNSNRDRQGEAEVRNVDNGSSNVENYRGGSGYRRSSTNYKSYQSNQMQNGYGYQGSSQRNNDNRNQVNQSYGGPRISNRGSRPFYHGQSSNRGYGYPRYPGNNYGRMQRSYPPFPVTNFIIPTEPFPAPPLVDPRISAPPQVSIPQGFESIKPPRQELDPLRQVEYYFSDENLKADIFIRCKMDQEGWVDCSVIHSFNRIRTKNLSFDEFVGCLSTTECIEVDFEKKRVRTKNNPSKWPLTQEQAANMPSAPSISPPVSVSATVVSAGQRTHPPLDMPQAHPPAYNSGYMAGSNFYQMPPVGIPPHQGSRKPYPPNYMYSSPQYYPLIYSDFPPDPYNPYFGDFGYPIAYFDHGYSIPHQFVPRRGGNYNYEQDVVEVEPSSNGDAAAVSSKPINSEVESKVEENLVEGVENLKLESTSDCHAKLSNVPSKFSKHSKFRTKVSGKVENFEDFLPSKHIRTPVNERSFDPQRRDRSKCHHSKQKSNNDMDNRIKEGLENFEIQKHKKLKTKPTDETVKVVDEREFEKQRKVIRDAQTATLDQPVRRIRCVSEGGVVLHDKNAFGYLSFS